MGSWNSRESAEWAIAVDAEAGKLVDGINKALDSSAARGFPAPPGDVLAMILSGARETKTKLVESNGKIFDTRRGILFQEQEFELTALMRIAKLAMLLYSSQIFEALEIETAQVAADRETSRADVERTNATTELRMKSIIINRSEAERRVIVYKQQLVLAQEQTLAADRILIQAQLETAEKKLQIIDAIYQLLAAEQLVVAADQRRAASLQKVLAAEFILAGIKQEMVPYYLQKAGAEQKLAQAITDNLPIEQALIELGYDRIDLKTTEEYAGHLTREQEEELELLKEDFTRADTAYKLTAIQNRRLLLEYRNQVQALILAQKKSLQEQEIDFRLTTGLQREAIGVNNQVAVATYDRGLILAEINDMLANIETRTMDEVLTVTASGKTNTYHLRTRTGSETSNDTNDIMRTIVVGAF